MVSVQHEDEAVILDGVAEPVVGVAVRRRFLEAANAKYGEHLDDDGAPRYVVRPRVVFAFVDNDTFPGTATRWTFDA